MNKETEANCLTKPEELSRHVNPNSNESSLRMTQRLFYPSWTEIVVFAADGIRPQILLETPNFIAVLAGLEAGQKIPAHRAPASAYHFLEGTGLMILEGERFPVTAGATVVVPNGACRAIEAETRLALLGTQAENLPSR